MDRIGEHQGRLQLPRPYILFLGIPALAQVQARVHGWELSQNESYAFDFGERPVLYNVPAAAAPPAATQLRMPNALVRLEAGGVIPAGGDHTDEYIKPYDWQDFTPAISGALVPHGKAVQNFQMPDLPAAAPRGLRPYDDLAVMRFRWKGAGSQLFWDSGVSGTGKTAGPYTLDLTGGGAFRMPIVPGTVRIQAPAAVGNMVVRDWPWPTAVEAKTCQTGRMMGDIDPNVDSTINYETGNVVVTFSAIVAAGPPNILVSFEYDYSKQPIDYRVGFDVNAI